MDAVVQFRVLGPLEAERDGRAVELGPHKARLLLALLLARPQQAVSADHLVETLWNGAPPPSASANLRTYVHRIRAALGADLIRGRGRAGYVLDVTEEQLDSAQFLSLATRGMAAGSTQTGRDLLTRALALFRGPAYSDFAEVEVLAAERARLNAYRLSAIEHLVDTDLALGRHADVIPQLNELVAEHPFRERFHAQLMLALHRSGRRAEALDAYRRVERLLATELGIRPQAELTALHTGMLRGEIPAAPTVPAVPAQLPPTSRVFRGRGRELARLTEILGDRVATGTPVVIAAIGGIGGVGKTWLALQWAHRHLDRFPDGTLFVDLRGYDPVRKPLTTSEVVRGFLHALGVPPSSVPSDVAAQVGLYRSLVAGRRILLVLDNARDTDQVMDLLPGSGRSTVLITSRNRLTGLVAGRGAETLSLDVLDDHDARTLLLARLGRDAEGPEVDEVVAACAGLPLALGIVAARAATQPGVSLSDIAVQLRERTRRLDALDEGEAQASVRAVLSWSTAALTGRQAAMFGVLGLAPGRDVGIGAAAALSGLPRAETEVVLRELERQSLISQTSPGRWQLHDLVKLYAAEEAHRVVADEDGALRRLADHLNDTAHAADCVLNPRRATEPSVPGSGPDSPVDLHAALRWFDTEYAGIREAQQIAYDRGWFDVTWQLARNLDTFHWRRHLAEERFAVWRIGVDAADRLEDSGIRGRAARLYGDACIRVGRHEEGLTQLDRALRIAEAEGDEFGIVHSLTGLAHACAQTGDLAAALHHAKRSLDLARHLDNPATEADRLNAVGWYSLRLGHTDDARRHLAEALALIRGRGHPYTEAAVLDSIATLEAQTGRHECALARYEEAIPLIEEAGDSRHLAESWQHIGDMNARLGRTGPARAAWKRALALFEEQQRLASVIDLRRRLVEGP